MRSHSCSIKLFSSQAAISESEGIYSHQQLFKYKFVVNSSGDSDITAVAVWFIIYLMPYLVFFSLFTDMQWLAKLWILFCNPALFMFHGHVILDFQLLCLHLFFLPNLPMLCFCQEAPQILYDPGFTAQPPAMNEKQKILEEESSRKAKKSFWNQQILNR